jgi:hypothetical protein
MLGSAHPTAYKPCPHPQPLSQAWERGAGTAGDGGVRARILASPQIDKAGWYHHPQHFKPTSYTMGSLRGCVLAPQRGVWGSEPPDPGSISTRILTDDREVKAHSR